MKEILTIIGIFCVFVLTGQNYENQGFIVTNDLDTIYGQVKNDFRHRLANRVKFKVRNASKFKYYTPNEISAFGFKGNERYKSFLVQLKLGNENEGKPKRRFFRRLVEGKLNLNVFEKSNKKRFFIENGQGQLLELPETKKKIEVGSRTFLEEDLSAVRRLKNVFHDCKQAYYLIDNGLVVRRNNLIKLVNTYNECYEKNVPNKILFQKESNLFSIAFLGGYPSDGDGGLGYDLRAEIMIPSWTKVVSLGVGYTIFPSNQGDYTSKPLTEFAFRLNAHFNANRRFNPYGFLGIAQFSVADQVEVAFIDQNGFITSELRDGTTNGLSEYYGLGFNYFLTSNHHLKGEFTRSQFSHFRLGYGYRF